MSASAAATMTTPVDDYRDAETMADASARGQFNGALFLDTLWHVPLLRRLFTLERLPAGWDGHGSPPIGPEVGSQAIRLLSRIAGLGVEDVPLPFVGPVSGGGVVLEWGVGSRQLSLVVLPEGRITYLKWEADEEFEEDQLTLRSAARLRELVTWLTSQPTQPPRN